MLMEYTFPPLIAMEGVETPAPPPSETANMSEENGGAIVAPEAPVGPDPASFSLPPSAEDEEGDLPVDFERLWKVAHDNPQDFTAWTDLLQYCEQEVCVVLFWVGFHWGTRGASTGCSAKSKHVLLSDAT